MRIRREILNRLLLLLADAEKGPAVILRAEVLVDRLDVMRWLSVQASGSRGFWSDRDGDFQLAGVGRADVISGDTGHGIEGALEQVHQRLEFCECDIRYFGGMRFSPSRACSAEWRSFQGYRFLLPRFEVVCRGGVTTFACNMRSDDSIGVVEQELARVVLQHDNAGITIPSPTGRVNRPDRREWEFAVGRILHGISEHRFSKVVLARSSTLDFDMPVNAVHLLGQLKDRTVNAFQFCFQPDEKHAFIGASPERLYRRDGRRLRTEAIAGTRLRGGGDAEDNRLAEELFCSEKERREHRIVVEGIEEALDPYVDDLASDEQPEVLKLAHNQHLITRFRGMLRSGVHDGQVLTALHPTAAVGGSPSDPAVREIGRLEPFDRGYFAAPVGWVERDAAQFVVGIRSALVETRRVHLYAGAGIVDGSLPAEEWEETEGKMAPLLDLFCAP